MGLKSRRKRREARAGQTLDVESTMVETAEERVRHLRLRQMTFNAMWKDMLVKLLYICGIHALYSAYTNMDHQLAAFHELMGVVCLYFARKFLQRHGREEANKRDEMICLGLAFFQLACYTYLALTTHRIVQKCLPLSSLLFLTIYGSLYFMKSSESKLEGVAKELMNSKQR